MENKKILTDNENTPKTKNRREWVKNIIIVFLLVMLLLTFFSNTIMNYSLPEVSVVKLMRDSISKSNPVSITVEANKSYTVTSDDAREIKRVAVKKGQEVKEGQVLFYLKEVKDSEEVKILQKDIDTLKLAYEKALMKSAPDYYVLNLAVQKARDELNQAISNRDNPPSQPEYVDNSAKIAELTARKNTLESDQACLESQKYSSLSQDRYNQISEKLSTFTALESEYNDLRSEVDRLSSVDTSTLKEMKRELETLEAELNYLIKNNAKEEEIDTKKRLIQYKKEDIGELETNEALLKTAKENLDAKTQIMNTAKSDLDSAVKRLSGSINSELVSVSSELMIYQNSGSGDGTMYPSGGDSGAGVDYDEAVRVAQYALNEAVHSLEKQIADDKLADGQQKLEIEASRKEIEEKEKDLTELLSKQGAAEIKSPVEGVVESIAAMAGQAVEPNAELLVLNISGDGFTAEYLLESEKVRKLSKGTEVKVIDNSDDITVTVNSLSKDKTDNKKMKVMFSVTGSGVVAGQNLKIDIGDAAATLDNVIPKTAVKTDSSGNFVYVVKSKNSPLGNKYIVEKVAVSITAEDDTKAAVSGDFGDSADYIITASSKPFNSGDQVRLSEE